jgi:6-phosphogluconolactonase
VRSSIFLSAYAIERACPGPIFPDWSNEIMKSFRLVLAVCLLAAGVFPATQIVNAEEGRGAVFVMTNAANGNHIESYARSEDGSLQWVASLATGGNGSGGTIDPLHSQGALRLSPDHHLLFAVNAASGTVSSFRVNGTQLALADTVDSGGAFPSALAQAGNVLYVLNAGGNGNVTGFRVNASGHLQSIPHSTRNLSGPSTSPTSLDFSPNGQFLTVVESSTNNVDLFRVFPNGTLSDLVANPTPGASPFAALFAPNGTLIVAGTANTISSFRVNWNQTIDPITESLPTDGKATCWSVITPNGRIIYAINAGTSNIAGYTISRTGVLTPIGATIVGSNPDGSTNLDTGISEDGKYVYTLNAGTGSVGIFSVQSDGTLLNIGQVTGLPAAAGLNGLAAF